MPMASFTFNLPEEQEEYDIFRRGADAFCALRDILNLLQYRVKNAGLSGDRAAEAAHLQSEIHSIVDNNEVHPWA